MPALTLCEQPGQEDLYTVDRSPQVDVDREMPIVVGHRRDRTGQRDTRVVEHEVHGAEQPERLVGEMAHLIEVPHIADHAMCLESLGAQSLHRIGERRFVDVAEHHLCPP